MPPAIAIDRQPIAEFCRRHNIRKLALFGSVLRDDFGPDSDVDVLVEFEEGHVPGFICLARIQREFSAFYAAQKFLLWPDWRSESTGSGQAQDLF